MSWERDLAEERKLSPIVREWLGRVLPLKFIRDATDWEQRNTKIDYVFNAKGRPLYVEAKIRLKDYGDLLLETVSNVKFKTPGWLHSSKADLLAYCTFKRGKLVKGYIFHLPSVRNWWIREGQFSLYPIFKGKTDGLYETENHAVPVKHIPIEATLYSAEHGALKNDLYYNLFG